MLQYVDSNDLQQFLESLPNGLILLDRDGKINWVNETLCKMTGQPQDFWLGLTQAELEQDYAGLLSEGHTCLPATAGNNVTDVVCIRVPMGEYQLQLCEDISSLASLKRERGALAAKLAELDPRDKLTGLFNKRALFQNLEQQTSRSRRYGNLLSVMILRLANLSDLLNQHDEDKMNAVLIDITHMLNDQMRWADVIGRLSDTEFMFIMPETDAAGATDLSEKINKHLQRNSLPALQDSQFELQTEVGIAQWRKGDDPALLLQRARDEFGNTAQEKLAVS